MDRLCLRRFNIKLSHFALITIVNELFLGVLKIRCQHSSYEMYSGWHLYR